MALLIQLFDGCIGRVFTSFLSHSSRVGLIPPVIVHGMRRGTISVTEGQTDGTVFRLWVMYILRIPTSRGGIPAQSFMELLMIGIRQFFRPILQIAGRGAEIPQLCHEPRSSKEDTLVNHLVKNISIFFLHELQFAHTIFSLHLEKLLGDHFLRASLTWKRPMLVGNLVSSLHQD